MRRAPCPSLLAARRTTNRWPIRRSSCSRSPRFICRRARICRAKSHAGHRQRPRVSGGEGGDRNDSRRVEVAVPMAAGDAGLSILDPAASCGLQLGGERFGYVGRLTQEAMRRFDLRGPAVVAEVRLGPLVERPIVPACACAFALSGGHAQSESGGGRIGAWANIAATAREHGGPLRVGRLPRCLPRPPAARRRQENLLFSFALRSSDGTLTSKQANNVRDQIVAACPAKHGAS